MMVAVLEVPAQNSTLQQHFHVADGIGKGAAVSATVMSSW